MQPTPPRLTPDIRIGMHQTRPTLAEGAVKIGRDWLAPGYARVAPGTRGTAAFSMPRESLRFEEPDLGPEELP